MSAGAYELRLEDGRVVQAEGKDGPDAARRYADLHGATVIAWRAPRIGIYVGAPCGAGAP
jgi:hypothetical protein